MKENAVYDGLLRADLTNSAASANLIFNEKVKALIKEGRQIYHFGFGQSPFPIPECMTEGVKEFAHTHAYLPMVGIPELREEIVKLHAKYDGVKLSTENIVVAPGSKELIYLIMATFSGDIILPGPAWTTYSPQAKLAAKNTKIITTQQANGWKITAEELSRALEQGEQGRNGVSSEQGVSRDTKWKILILTNPGNPCGTCFTDDELQALSVVCRERKVLVLSDEIYARLTFNRTHATMVKHYPEGTILTSGFSKWASAGGWRLGYAHFPPTLQPLFQAVKNAASHTYSCAPTPMQFGVAKALRENCAELDRYMTDCARILKAVGDYCFRELQSVGVKGVKSEAGYYFMPDFEVVRAGLKAKGWTTGDEMTRAMLEEANVALMSSKAFLLPPTDLSTRFCFVCFDGAKALKKVEDMPGDAALSEDFLREYCLNVVEGVQSLKKWVQKYTL